ncbi:hypothetical protein LTR37_002027 [Vermiconidia calcicola]|uniref:Uncharacterized protein n=1 Tax=Vermiconidia calcicola TaxID=1690605 RepID=A0ACC3NTG2_9PEZI|nr:hypothetical protein LTR37_002027 [Vermiconidia calcicola]
MAHKDKTALVTGAAGGLGRAIAEEFLRQGANVIICDINKDLVSDFKEKVSAAYPECTLVLDCNITDDAAIDDMFEQGEKKFGKIDYVVNNAGIMDRFDPAGEVERKMWDRVIALNLTAPTFVTKRAVSLMIKHEIKGSIVNICSIAGIRGFTSGAAYTASKHGLLGLTKNTAAFYGPKNGIRCNAIMAGGMQTNIASAFQETGINMEGLGIMRKTFPEDAFAYVEIEKVAKLVLYLCSEEGSIVNGATWTADGGSTAN